MVKTQTIRASSKSDVESKSNMNSSTIYENQDENPIYNTKRSNFMEL